MHAFGNLRFQEHSARALRLSVLLFETPAPPAPVAWEVNDEIWCRHVPFFFFTERPLVHYILCALTTGNTGNTYASCVVTECSVHSDV